jgi:hypothetical protein
VLYVPFDRVGPKAVGWGFFENPDQGHRDAQRTRDRKGMENDLSGMLRPIDTSDDVLDTGTPISLLVTLRND